MLSSKTLIVIKGTSRRFFSIESLWKSGHRKASAPWGTERYHCCWWKDNCVMFPGEEGRSSAFVEVTGLTVTVGHPSFYKTFSFGSYWEALAAAEKINNKWLASDQEARDFVEALSRPEAGV